MPSPAETSPDVSAADTIEERILDGALAQFERVGVKKSTIEDIARRAGVDRVTVYRRIGSRDDVVRAVTAREVRRLLTELDEIPERHETLDDIVADVFVTVITRWRTHPLIERLLALEPERLLGQVTTEGGPPFLMSVTTTVAILRRAVERGLCPDHPDLTDRVEIACRVVHSLIVQPVGAIDLDSAERLDSFARTYLVPILSR
ncbi:TetR/AcrR family transcriptional regulator [Nocardia puris]|uniref:TetR family transcriptional regulator n=1 Tax=Nocardia puris TaxID=208602 RepID=A0A366CX29_9NOCA|nr:TetR/AcrR family transcriptional regulator [Nocardia puris]RBO82391.1 TetR family transcriptional regulator [Nocardia puris]